MRIASNTLGAQLDYYHKELKGAQPKSEIEALFSLAVEHYLHIPRKHLTAQLGMRLNHSEILKIYDCCKALAKHIPIQYVLGETWFLNVKLKINPSVLIPRPETEELVDRIIKENKNAHSFLDIGTGSGAIPIAIKTNLPSAVVSACDISESALEIARCNAKNLLVHVHFFNADVLNVHEFAKRNASSYDVIVSNPPYILAKEKSSMEKQVLENEPHLALFVEGNDAVVFYRKIIELCVQKLNPGGNLYFELNPLTASEVEALAISSRLFSEVRVINDLSGKSRFLSAKKKG